MCQLDPSGTRHFLHHLSCVVHYSGLQRFEKEEDLIGNRQLDKKITNKVFSFYMLKKQPLLGKWEGIS